MNYEELLIEADSNNLITKEKPLLLTQEELKEIRIAIKQTYLHRKKKPVSLLRNLDTSYTSTGNILDMSDTSNRKQELRARLWAYNKQIGLRGLIDCYKANCKSIHEMAEYLDVTEEFLLEAIECYRSKYGVYAKLDNYFIGFIPTLYIIEEYMQATD